MSSPFVEYLVERNLVSQRTAQKLLDDKRYVREPIGMLAVSHGLLKPNEVDTILDRQRGAMSRFGEVAIRLGMLSEHQVQTLLRIQEFRAAADIAEALALSDELTCEDAAAHLGAFLLRDQEVLAVLHDA